MKLSELYDCVPEFCEKCNTELEEKNVIFVADYEDGYFPIEVAKGYSCQECGFEVEND